MEFKLFLISGSKIIGFTSIIKLFQSNTYGSVKTAFSSISLWFNSTKSLKVCKSEAKITIKSSGEILFNISRVKSKPSSEREDSLCSLSEN